MDEPAAGAGAGAAAGAAASIGPSSAALAAASASAGLFRRKNRAGGGAGGGSGGAAPPNLRKRGGAGEGSGGDDDDEGGVVRKAKQVKGEPLAFSTKRDEKEDLGVRFEGSRTIQEGRDQAATRALETETQFDRDARAIREKVLKQGEVAVVDDGTYKGINGYVDYRAGFRREHNVGAEKGTGSHGPLRGSAYMRVSARFDYQPDLCKDYKETGFCSYGDSCKFMHDRGDYKSGWELEKMWEEEQKKKADALAKGWKPDGDDDGEGGEAGAGEGGGEDDDSGLPFACFICRREWEEAKNPVVTKCKHYFCESCALKHNAKTSKCAVCGQTTSGIFNVANDVIKAMKKKQQRQ